MPNLLSRARTAVQGLARRALNIQPGQYQGYTLSAPVLSGITVTPQTALTLSAFFCGVTVLSTDVAKLPFGLYREARGGGTRLAKNDPRNRLARFKPNGLMNSMRYRQMQMGHVLGWGGHFSEIKRDGDGNPVSLWPLHPGTTKLFEDDQSKALYYQDINTGKKYRPEDIIHIAGLGFDGLSGYAVPLVGRQAIGLGIAAEQFGASLFGNGARPGGLLKLGPGKKLSSDAAKRLRESFENVHGSTLNANRTAVLEEGMDWVETQISPEAAQFLATRLFQVHEVARLLNMPPHKLGDYSQSHLTNVEESNRDYVSSTLQGWLTAIEAEYNHKLLFDDERDVFTFSHDMNALLRGNMQARSSYYTSRFQVGSISVNEIRQAEGQNPIREPNADKTFLQAQYVPLDKAGEAMAPSAPADPAKPPEEPAKPPGKRMNPNHGADGKFSSGHGGGGFGRFASSHELEAEADRLGQEHADHPDPPGHLQSVTGITHPDPEWLPENRDAHREMAKLQDSDRKEHARDQARERKQFDREQEKELAGFDRDQKRETKEFEREDRDQAKAFERTQKEEAEDFDAAEAEARKEHLAEHGDDPAKLAEFEADAKADRDEFAASLAADRADFDASRRQAREEHDAQLASERKDFLEEQASSLEGFLGDLKEATETLHDDHRDERVNFVSALATELFHAEADAMESPDA